MRKNVLKLVLGLAITIAVLNLATTFATAASFNIAGPAANNIDTNPATSIMLNVSQGGTIADLNLNINISTPYADDVDIFLIHNGVTVHVYDAIGDTPGSFINATFDDEATANYPANGTVNGTFRPSPDSLSAFDGLELSGVWELRLLDTIVPGDLTDLISWSISGTTAAICSYTMNIPTSPANIGTFAPGIFMSYDPMVARPFGLGEAGDMLTGSLWLPCWRNGHVDVYLVIPSSPYGSLVMDHFHQWLPFPANIQPWMTYTDDDVYTELFSYLKSGILPGNYKLDVIIVPSGTAASTIDQIVSGATAAPYYKWSFTETLP